MSGPLVTERLRVGIIGVSWGAKVHHTAVAELSIVKKGATIGASASPISSVVQTQLARLSRNRTVAYCSTKIRNQNSA